MCSQLCVLAASRFHHLSFRNHTCFARGATNRIVSMCGSIVRCIPFLLCPLLGLLLYAVYSVYPPRPPLRRSHGKIVSAINALILLGIAFYCGRSASSSFLPDFSRSLRSHRMGLVEQCGEYVIVVGMIAGATRRRRIQIGRIEVGQQLHRIDDAVGQEL